MRKYSAVVLSVLALSSFGLFLSSCKDDEPTTYQLTFSETEITADEADGPLDIVFTLSKPAPEDITVTFSLGGTARDLASVGSSTYLADYGIEGGDYSEVVIEKGETSAIIPIVLFSDDYWEDDETIEITIDEVDVNHVEFEAGATTTVTVTQEDGKVVVLEWPAASPDGVADMDIIVRVGETAETPEWDGIVTGSVYRGFDSDIELVFIPNAFTGTNLGLDYTNTTFGLSYTYYDGDLDPLDFTVSFVDFTNGELEDEEDYDVFEQSYTAANKNKWESSSVPTIIAQTFVNNNGVFSDISEISVQEESSRTNHSLSNQILSPRQTPTSGLRVLDAKDIPAKLKSKLRLK